MNKTKILSLILCVLLAVGLFSACSSNDILQNYRYKISKTDLELHIGEGCSLAIIGKDLVDTNTVNVEWSSENSKVATVDEFGYVIGNSEGKTKIIAHVTSPEGSEEKVDVKYSCNVSVLKNGVTLEKFEFTSSEIEIVKGQVFSPRLTSFPSNADNRSYTLTSSNAGIVSVEEDGRIRGVAEGKATITAKTDDGKFETTATVTVTKEKDLIESITLSDDSLTIIQGESASLSAQIKPSNLGFKVTWSSNNLSVATVNNRGVVTAKKAGVATITATVKDILTEKTVSCTVTVEERAEEVAATSISLEKTSLSIKIGDTNSYNFNATIFPANTTSVVSWTSSNPNLISVNARTGEFTLIGTVTEETTVTLTVRAGAISKAATVTVLPEGSEGGGEENITPPENGTVIKVEMSMQYDLTVGNSYNLSLSFTPQIDEAEKGAISIDFGSSQYYTISPIGFGEYSIFAQEANMGEIIPTVSSSSDKNYIYEVIPISYSITNSDGSQGTAFTFKQKATDATVSVGESPMGELWIDCKIGGKLVNAAEAGVTFESSNPSVVSVNSYGWPKGVSVGEAQIFAKRAGETIATLNVTVTGNPAPEVKITFDKTTISAGSPVTATIKVTGGEITAASAHVEDGKGVTASAATGTSTEKKITFTLADGDFSGDVNIDFTITLKGGSPTGYSEKITIG